MSMFSSQQQQAEWKPRTTLGQQVLAGKITSMDQIYENGLRIQESEIVKHLLPDIKSQVVHVGIVQKQTGADRLTIGGALAANIHGRGLRLQPFVADEPGKRG